MKICKWIKRLFGNSKIAFEELEEFKAKFSNPLSVSTADKGQKICLASYHK